jgi:asparagine synthase (glutamine-hydrolysing)
MGMTRLAILDPTARANQPMTRDGVTLIYNGEVYNFAKLRAELRGLGHSFTTAGDTEVVLAAILQWGTEALSRMSGMFALAWWSEPNQSLTAARDEYGIKPLYWRSTEHGGLALASEARVLRQPNPGVSPSAIREYLTFGSPVASVVFDGVRELPPGFLIEIHQNQVTLSRWAGGLTRRSDTATSPAQALASSVVRQLVADRPVAIFLSGGFDSAMIAAVARNHGASPLAVTLKTSDNDEDVRRAARTAKHYGLEHHIRSVEPNELQPLMRDFVAAQDQPTLDGFNTYLVSRAARAAGCVVALSGLGGDEVLGGYRYYARSRARALLAALPPRLAFVVSPVIARMLGRPASTITAYAGARGTLERYLASRQVFAPREVRNLTGQAPTPRLGLRLEEGCSERRQLSQLDFEVYLRTTLLRDADVFSMRHGLELRVPLLDRSFVGAVFTLEVPPTKASLAYDLGDDYLQQVAGESKLTFSLPWRLWLDALGPVVDDLLGAADPWRGMLDPCHGRRVALARESRQDWLRPWALVLLAMWLSEHEDA